MLVLTKAIDIPQLDSFTNYTLTKAIFKSDNSIYFEIVAGDSTYRIDSLKFHWLIKDLCTIEIEIEDRTILTQKDVIDMWFKNPKNLEILYFFGHKQYTKEIDESCLSQWYIRSFRVENKVYTSMEQYMMHAKALLFKDIEIAEEIMRKKNPGEIKRLGREVKNFNAKIWERYKYKIVLKGNICKFLYNVDLFNYMESSDVQIFAEASPYYDIWGIKLSVDKAYDRTPQHWKGRNLLGFALTDVKSIISKNIR